MCKGPVHVWRSLSLVEEQLTKAPFTGSPNHTQRTCSHVENLFTCGDPVYMWRTCSHVENLFMWRTYLHVKNMCTC